jgi:hypothetical protein
MPGSGGDQSWFHEVTFVLVRLHHLVSVIVNADHSIM